MDITDLRQMNARINAKFEELSKVAKFNTDYDIPYLAGYSEDGKTVYLDRHFAKFSALKWTWKYLFIHELTEKAALIESGMTYQKAHHDYATRKEKAALISRGNSWAKYSRMLAPWIKKVDKETVNKIPKDLDLQPYTDSNDIRILREITGRAANMKCPVCYENNDPDENGDYICNGCKTKYNNEGIKEG